MTNWCSPVPVSHGAHRVALSAFGTVFGVALLVLFAAVLTGQSFPAYAALLSGMVGAVLGYGLWRSGAYVLATILHTGGLLGAGVLVLVATESLGGATSVLFLASVISGGGLLGWRGAVVACIAAAGAMGVGTVFADTLRLWFGLPIEPFVVPESIMAVFVLASIPSWGIYVVAIDASNRAAWRSAATKAAALAQSNEQLDRSNRALLAQKAVVERAVEQQAAVARIGLLANGPASVAEVNQQARMLLSRWLGEGAADALSFGPLAVLERVSDHPAADQAFARGVLQVLEMRERRERSVAERARLAAQIQNKERQEALGRMAGEVAHDFNNALMSIVSSVERLELSPVFPGELRPILHVLWESTRRSEHMTQQLLRVAQGRPLATGRCAVGLVIMGVVTEYRGRGGEKQVCVLGLPSEDAWVGLLPEDLARVIANLVENAFGATPRGGEVRILVRRDERTDTVQILVSDDGAGMDDGTLARLGEPFFSSGGGTGLGVSIVKSLVEGVGGTVSFQSELGRGTTVTVTFPQVAPLLAQDGPTCDAERQPMNRRQVLLVDDAPTVRRSVRLLLESLGWEVVEASGEADIDVLTLSQFALLVCDVRLGEDFGPHLVQQLRQNGLRAAVLYISGYVEPEQLPSLAGELLLFKPFRARELRAAIVRLGADCALGEE